MKKYLLLLGFALLLSAEGWAQFAEPRKLTFTPRLVSNEHTEFLGTINYAEAGKTRMGDFNGDRRADLIDYVFGELSQAGVYWNLPGGTIGDTVSYFLGRPCEFIKAIQLNDDRWMDAVVRVGEVDSTVRYIFLLNSSGQFNPIDSLSAPANGNQLFDWDFDGDDDLIVLDMGMRQIRLRRNNGGRFDADTVVYQIPSALGTLQPTEGNQLFVLDLQDDSLPDVGIMTDRDSTTTSLCQATFLVGTDTGLVLGQQIGNIYSGIGPEHFSFSVAKFVDITGDGKKDIIRGRTFNQFFLQNRGDGTFSKLTRTDGMSCAFDADGDGRGELFNFLPYDVNVADTTSYRIMVQDSAGRIRLDKRLKRGQREEFVEPADIDGDGLMDLVFREAWWHYTVEGYPTSYYWQPNLGGMNFGKKRPLYSRYAFDVNILPIQQPAGILNYDQHHIYFLPRGNPEQIQPIQVVYLPPIGMNDSMPNRIAKIFWKDSDGNGTKEIILSTNRGFYTCPVQSNAPLTELGGPATSYWGDANGFLPTLIDLDSDSILDVVNIGDTTTPDGLEHYFFSGKEWLASPLPEWAVVPCLNQVASANWCSVTMTGAIMSGILTEMGKKI